MADDIKLCGAKTRTGSCHRRPATGKNRCRYHGGVATVGRPITRLETLQKHLGERFGYLFHDAELKKIDADLALCLVREGELASRLEDGESPEWRAATLELVMELDAAIHAADGEKIWTALSDLKAWVQDAVDRDATWDHLQKNSLVKSKLLTDQAAIETKASNVLTGKNAIAFMLTVFSIVKQEAGEETAFRIGHRFKTELAEVLQGDAAANALPASTA